MSWKKLIFLFISFSLASCGEIIETDLNFKDSSYVSSFTTSDPQFDKYKRSFEEDYYVETGQVISTEAIHINLKDKVDDKNSYVGICIIWPGGQDIIIKEAYWKTLSEFSRKAIVYHELGHCALGRTHDNSLDEDGRATSIMNQYLIAGSQFYTYYEQYIRELFTEF